MDWLSLFPGASRDKPRLMALAGAVLRQAEDLITVIEALQPASSFAAAEGIQLDSLTRSGPRGCRRGCAGRSLPAVPAGKAGPVVLGRDKQNRPRGAERCPAGQQADRQRGRNGFNYGDKWRSGREGDSDPGGDKNNEELILNALIPLSRESGDYIIMNCEL